MDNDYIRKMFTGVWRGEYKAIRQLITGQTLYQHIKTKKLEVF